VYVESEVADMRNNEKIKELMEVSQYGTITAEQVTAAGLHRSILQELVENGELYRFSRGLYVRTNVWEDDFYLLQRKYGRGIYSHDTALYLHGYSDRTPAQYTMTFPKGYNTPSLKNENIIIKRTIMENYSFGIVEINSPCGNPIRVYDLERSLCDILRGSGSDIQIVGAAMKKYATSKEKDIHKLMQYADKLRVKPKVLRYMEVLL
jgi:predicted transcriptional regulator of viral defense system